MGSFSNKDERQMNKSQKEYYRQFSQHGTGDARIEISASEVALLLFIAYHDIYDTFPSQEFPPISKLACKDFYKITFEEINSLPQITPDECFYLLEKAGATNINDAIYLYLKNLCDLYRRRYKYDKIMPIFLCIISTLSVAIICHFKDIVYFLNILITV